MIAQPTTTTDRSFAERYTWNTVNEPSGTSAANETTPLIERVWVINLDRRPDRWAQFLAHIEQFDWPFATPRRFVATDGAREPAPAWWKGGPGAWGCYRTKQRLLAEARRDPVERLLILEDDVCFRRSRFDDIARWVASVPDDWDQLYLGGQHLGRGNPAPRVVAPDVLRGFNVNRDHATIIRSRFLQPLAEHLDDLDMLANSRRHHADHHIGALHVRGETRVYTPRRWFAGQRAGHSDITNGLAIERYWDLPDNRRFGPE